MSGTFNRPKHRRRPAINITSLIDVMFLLLIFFMVSSTFREDTGIDIRLPEAETASQQPMGAHEIVIDREGQYYIGKQRVDEERLREALVQLIADGQDTVFVLRADKDAAFGKVLRAIDIARDVGGERLIIPTDLLEVPPPE